ncbi:bacteriohemerythrin [Sulfurimonas sp.]|uniref:bacteriohemerythrin n=1 Tax=Sulfurimonas sp. TaxID=2022749 RepID=UPI0025FF6129|nr:bacteriohemerythrin [Sulfurimonas sp.]
MQSIDIFPWDDHFNTGLDTIDQQHCKLVEILNRFARYVIYNSNEEELETIFDELIDYTHYHFQTEEAIWEKHILLDSINEEHVKGHQSFSEKVLKLKSQRDVKTLCELASEAIEFLVKWLASHILESDREMSYIVFALQDGNSIEEARMISDDKVNNSSTLLTDIIISIYSAFSSNTLSLMRELKAHKNFEKKVEYQEEYRQLLLNLSTSFINLPLEKIDPAINSALETMATFVEADRAYIFDYDFTKNTSSNTYEWCNEGILSKIDSLQNISLDIAPKWLKIHLSGEPILSEDVFLLADIELRDMLLSKEIRSLITFPLMKDSACKGFVGFETVSRKYAFTNNDTELLKLFSKLLVNIDERKHIELELYHEKNLLKTLVQTIPDLVWLKDVDGNFLACNTRFEEFFGAKESEIIGKNDYDFVTKELADFFRKKDQLAIENSKEYVEEKELIFASDGHKEVLQTTKVAMYSAEGKLMGVLGTARDITHKQELQKKLIIERDRFEHYLETVEAMIVLLDANGIITLINRKGCELLGYTQEELIGQLWFELCLSQPVGMEVIYPIYLDIMAGKQEGTEYYENTIETKSGDKRLIAWHSSYEFDEDGKIFGSLSAGEDITERQQHQHHLEYIAHYDALTGLPNRVLLSDRIQQALAQTARHNLSLAVVYLDLDGFKAVNDTHGHANGDKLLALVAQRMKNTLRDGDTIARLGGDEFVAVLLDLKTHEDSTPMLKRLLHASSQQVVIDDIEMHLTASLGVAFYDAGDETDADQLLRQADQAMYQAKLLGKNRYCIFDAQKDKKLRTHHESLEEIAIALTNDEFVMYYQPKINMKSGEVVGAEALIRWNHPKYGILAPGRFLPIIQDHVLCVKLGKWVLDRVMQQIEEFQLNGINFPISINVDAMQLQEIDFVKQLKCLLKNYPSIKPKDFILEVLETSALSDVVHISHIMQECSDLGIFFSLDDFGTGYSSLTYLKRLPAKELKIDRSFVCGMLEDPDDLAILDGILGLSSAFRREVIAEGVESIEHGEILLKLGCEVAQGYIIAYPMPANEISGWIQEYKPNEKWKNTNPINRDDLPLLYALVEHKAWLQNIFSYLNDIHKTPPKLNHTECRFGEWLYEDGKRLYSKHPAYNKIEVLHRELHEVTNILIEKYDNNALIDLEATIDHIKELSKDLTIIFKEIENA